MTQTLSAIAYPEGDLFVSICLELDIASQGTTVNEAINNLSEALELFFEFASQNEVEARLTNHAYLERSTSANEILQGIPIDSAVTRVELRFG